MTTGNPEAPLLSLEHAEKSFGAVRALEDGTSSCTPARCTRSWARTAPASRRSSRSSPASTGPTRGRLLLDGEEAIFDSAKQSQAAGIAIIFQEPTLFPDLSVAENIFIGAQPLKRGHRIDRRQMRRDAAALFEQLGVRLDPDRLARGLSIADQQLVEIVKALTANARVIVMDEPTAALTTDRGRAAVRHRRDAARARRRRALHLAPARGGLRALPARHRDARRPPRADAADRGADDAVDHPRDGRPRHGRAVPEGARPSRAESCSRSSG